VVRDISLSTLDPLTVRRRIRTNQLNLEDPHTCLERHIPPGVTRNMQRVNGVRDDGQPKTQIVVQLVPMETSDGCSFCAPEGWSSQEGDRRQRATLGTGQRLGTTSRCSRTRRGRDSQHAQRLYAGLKLGAVLMSDGNVTIGYAAGRSSTGAVVGARFGDASRASDTSPNGTK